MAAEMRDQLLFCEEENAFLLLVDPDREMSFLSRVRNQEQRPQLIQFANLIQSNLCFRFAPLAQE